METAKKQEAIKNAVSAVTVHGFALPAALQKMVNDIANPQYRVAIVGKYQVGKSTLINKLFLKGKPLLTEGHGLCTTAVATDIEYGPTSKLEVYHWTDATQASETCVKTVENPTLEDVTAATVSSDQTTRSELAKQISRVRVTTPNDALRGYTVIDTPGLDDPEPDLLANTTFRIVPGSDVALMVVGARNLDEVEKNFLRNELMGKHGISRLLLMVSYNARTEDKDAAQRELVVKTIKAELDSIGRGDIEVQMYCFDQSIDDIPSDVSDIRLAIHNFLETNALPGREEKVASLVKRELETIQVQIAARLKATGVSEAEIAATQARVETEVAKFKHQCEQAFEGLKYEFNTVRDQMYNDVDLAVEGAFTRFYSQVESAPDFGAKKAKIEKAAFLIKSDLQSQISVVAVKLKERIKSALDAYASKIANVQVAWNLFLSEEFSVQRPFVSKIPTFALEIINIVIMDILLPGGVVIATIARVLAGKFGDPAKLIANWMVMSQLKKALDESQGEVRQQIMDQISANLLKTFNGVKTEIEMANQAQVEAIRRGIDSAASSQNAADRAALESAKADIENALAEL